MSDINKRREFIKKASLIGASIAMVNPGSAKEFFPGDEANAIKNNFFTISFDKKNGTISITRNNGAPLLTGGTVGVNLATNPAGTDIVKQSIAATTYKHRLKTSSFSDQVGTGKKLIIFSRDTGKKLDVETHLSLYDEVEAISFETSCSNVCEIDTLIHSLEPIRVVQHEGAVLNVPGVSKCITNGEMYFDAGMIHAFDLDKKETPLEEIKGVKLANKSVSSQHETIHSWWNVGLFSGYDKEGLVLGYLENSLCLGNVLLANTAADQISFLAESVYAPGLLLKPGKTIRSNRFMINIAADPYSALENYATAVGKLNTARIQSVINGWCSWFYTLSQVSEDEVIRNTEFAAKHLKQFGLEYIQVDEGFQKWHGDWEGNERFPHGMKWLAGQIKNQGFKAGIWISPYVISEPSEVFQKHPEWLLKKKDGSLQRVGNWPENSEPPADENPKRYCLDITHPEAARWLYSLVNRIADEWGYEMIKIDFVAWSVFAAQHYNDPSVSAAAVYREGMEIMRKAAGDKCHILECGPGAITVGLIDSMRIELDAYYGFAEAAWLTYFTHPASSMAAAGKRYYFHKRTWINDADHLCMSLLDNQQSEAAASIIALSGGNMVSGDRLTQLDSYKLDILKKITPSYGEAATPVDLFDTDLHSVFALKIKRSFGQWTVAGFFNASLTEPVEKEFSLKRLWLDPGKTWLVYDFWKQRFLGEITNEIKLVVQPGSARLVTLHEKTGKPQFISTDRHVLQGAVEMNDMNWDEDTKTISGISNGPLNTSHNVYVYVPGDHPWTWGGYVLYRDYDFYSLRLVDKNIIQVHVRFDKNEQVNWKINVDEYFN